MAGGGKILKIFSQFLHVMSNQPCQQFVYSNMGSEMTPLLGATESDRPWEVGLSVAMGIDVGVWGGGVNL